MTPHRPDPPETRTPGGDRGPAPAPAGEAIAPSPVLARIVFWALLTYALGLAIMVVEDMFARGFY